MNSKWMNKTFLALSIQMVMGVAWAADEPELGEYETVEEEVVETAASVDIQPAPAATQAVEEPELGGYETVQEEAVAEPELDMKQFRKKLLLKQLHLLKLQPLKQ